VFAGTAWFKLAWDPGPLSFTLDGVGATTFAGETTRPFLSQGYALLEVRVPVQMFAVGAYGMAGFRDFGLQNPIGDNDRTGAQAQAGLFGDWRGGQWAATARAGYVAEQARGNLQKVQGMTVAVSGSYATGDWRAALALSYALRDYTDNPLTRHDHVIEPALQGAYLLTENFRVVASYTLMAVQSLAPYTYNRHLLEAGVEAAW
jgi:hypothetical protein